MTDKAVIFDMDGVLVDSYRAHFESWRRLAGKYGFEFTERQFAATFGKTSREIIRQFFSHAVDEADIGRWDEQKEQFYREILQADFPEMDGAGELIRALHKAGFALAIGSSGPPENVAVVAKCLPAGELISATVNAYDVTHGKPDPDVFLQAAGKLGVEPYSCAVIEDAPVGVEAAHRAGMAAVAITGTAPAEKLDAADLVVDSLRQLSPKIISELIEKNRAN
ncbi:MAG: HAD family phosphatase [Phycisphaerae bacterium]|nr:HAD family phosphatase [Phycisphaerae bacterium]